jgi:hypothetical protein
VFTTSPATMLSPRSGRAPTATSASPVFTPTRTDRSSSGRLRLISSMAWVIRRLARTARSASSSCATGAPNTAMTASPMNFSTVPPNRSISCLATSWKARSVSRTSSGSARSDLAVNPTKSQNRTETTFRSSGWAAGCASRADPHPEQKRDPSGFCCPQVGQVNTPGVYAAFGCRWGRSSVDVSRHTHERGLAGGSPAGRPARIDKRHRGERPGPSSPR